MNKILLLSFSCFLTYGLGSPLVGMTEATTLPLIPLTFQTTLHPTTQRTYLGPAVPTEVLTVVGLGVSLATCGVASGFVAGAFEIGKNSALAAMGGAALSGVAAQTAVALVAQQGYVRGALQDLTAKESVKNLALSVATAGALKGLAPHLGIPTQPVAFSEHLHHAAFKSGVSLGLSTALGANPQDALRTGLISFGATAGGGYFAGQLGTAYSAQDIDEITHKAGHFAVGAMIGAAVGHSAPLNGALAGAIGAVAAESMAEFLRDDLLATQGFLTEDDLEQCGNIGRFTGSTFGTFLHPTAAICAADNAVENNFLPHALMAVSTAATAWMAYDLYDTYQIHGPEAALRKAGIEIVTIAATGGAMKIGFKVGSIVYPTAKTAWTAYTAVNPKIMRFGEYTAGAVGKVRESAGRWLPRKAPQAASQEVPHTLIQNPGISWGKGIQSQGLPWEDYLAKTLPLGSRLPKNFNTFDFYDMETKLAISAKTLNTQTALRISNPNRIYYSLKRNIDAAAEFVRHRLDRTELTSSIVQARQVEVAIPQMTTIEQWFQIHRAVEYAKNLGVNVNITVVK